MARFKLLASQHITADPDWVPTEEEKANAAAAGRPLRAPKRVYNAVDVVESETDLVAKFGHQKFQLIGESKKVPRTAGDAPAANPTVAPAGQVGSGLQHTTGVPEGSDPDGRKQVSGPMSPDEAKAAGGRPDAPLAGEGGEEDETADVDRTDDDTDEEDGAGDDAQDLHSMTVADLRALADTEEVDLTGASRKDDIIRAIEKARKG